MPLAELVEGVEAAYGDMQVSDAGALQ
jgi:hypothetical protein